MPPTAPATPATNGAPANGRPVRVVHYLNAVSLAAGGVTRAVLDLVDGLSRAGAAVTLLTADAADVPADWGGAGRPRVVDLGRLTLRGGRLDADQLRRAAGVIRGGDALHLHGVWEPANAQLAAVAHGLGRPYVVSVHGMLDDWSMNQSAAKRLKKEIYLRSVGRRYVGRAALIHLTADDERRQALPRLRRRPTLVLPLIIDLSPFRDPPGPGEARRRLALPPAARLLLFLSRVHPKKGLDKLIDALAILTRDGRDLRLAVGGGGEESYLRQLQDQAKTAGVADRIAWLGMVGGTLKTSLYEAAELFVLPTSQENFGLVLAEAMACGTPVVTTRGTDIWREIDLAGGTVTTADPNELAAAIAARLDDPADLEARGRRGREWVMQALDADRLAAAYLDAYRGLTAAPGTRGA